ncbi:MAG: DNA-directed RNA polymerase subunit P [Candidatus Aenigmatarchaeota archaeon]
MYKCLNCKKEIELKQVSSKIRCPFCGYRIIMKETPSKLVKSKAD